MFTIKYIYPSGQEMISGPFASVHAEWVDKDGQHIDPRVPQGPPSAHVHIYRIIYAHDDDGRVLTLGPNIPAESDTPQPPHEFARVYVMNESGATIAKYEL